MPAHGNSKAFPARDTDHIIQHVMHTFAVEHAPSSVRQECWPAQNSQLDAITNALGERWERQRKIDQSRLDLDNKFVYRKLELGESRASKSMFQTTHWRSSDEQFTVGSTLLNRVAAGHRIEEQNRVLFEHLLKARPGVVSNQFLKERGKKLDEKKKTMTKFRPQACFSMPALPRAFPVEEGMDEERHRVRLPPVHSSCAEEDVSAFREQGWKPTMRQDVRAAASRRDNRMRGAGVDTKNASSSRTHDPYGWCNRESTYNNSRMEDGSASNSNSGRGEFSVVRGEGNNNNNSSSNSGRRESSFTGSRSARRY